MITRNNASVWNQICSIPDGNTAALRTVNGMLNSSRNAGKPV